MSTVVLDGAMGTALLGAGLPEGSLPEQWLVDRAGAVAAIHRAHAAAGAEILSTCTFNLAGARLDRSALPVTVEDLARRAVATLRDAAPTAQVAGAVGPAWLEATADRASWRERHGRAFRALASAGADLLWVESAWELEEARIALAEASATGLPAVVTFGFQEERGRLRAGSGEPALECLRAVAADGAIAVGANCSLPGSPLAALIVATRQQLTVPIVAKPSAGLPGAVVAPDAFGAWIRELVEVGAAWVGGCCGATPAHVQACARAARRG